MKYLVTGGAGFIGSNLLDRLLSENHDVIVIDNFNNYYDVSLKQDNIKSYINNTHFQIYTVDIRDKKALDDVFKQHKFVRQVFQCLNLKS